MKINKELISYCEHAEEQSAYESMMNKAHQVADLLMSKPGGVCAEILGQYWFVAQINGEQYLDLFTCPDSVEQFVKPDDCNVMLINDIEGQSATDLKYIESALNAWLAFPAFIDCNQMILNVLVSHTYNPRQKNSFK